MDRHRVVAPLHSGISSIESIDVEAVEGAEDPLHPDLERELQEEDQKQQFKGRSLNYSMPV
jgi:hypothetical protein